MSSYANKIDTFVFFDLETTDLIKEKKMPKIIELSMIAVARNFIKCDNSNKLALPRIMHKLIIPIHPMRAINVEASKISNLWNDSLEDYKPFDENTYNLIMQFIERLPGLVCFVSHNGNRFDYPVFLSEFHKLNKILPDNILCIDTLPAFQEILSKMQVEDEQQPFVLEDYDEVDKESLNISNTNNPMMLLNDEWNDSLSSFLNNYEKGNTQKNDYIQRLSYETEKDLLDTVLSETEMNIDLSRPVTPDCSTSMQAINEKTPKSQIIKNTRSNKISGTYKNLNTVRRQLKLSNSKPQNFKLSTVYKHMIGYEAENLHCAEADCITMLRIVCQIASRFIEWADCNAKPLNNFKRNY